VTAPIQLLTIGVDEARVPDAVLEEFVRLHDTGLIRVLDVLFVRHGVEGEVDSIDRLDAARMQFDGSLLLALLTWDGAESSAPDEAVWSLVDAVPRGQLAALILVEHLWAAPLVAAMLAGGGQLFDELWLGSDDREALRALIAARG
jgi:hypothetical protein